VRSSLEDAKRLHRLPWYLRAMVAITPHARRKDLHHIVRLALLERAEGATSAR
jgi:hypothetical protein